MQNLLHLSILASTCHLILLGFSPPVTSRPGSVAILSKKIVALLIAGLSRYAMSKVGQDRIGVHHQSVEVFVSLGVVQQLAEGASSIAQGLSNRVKIGRHSIEPVDGP